MNITTIVNNFCEKRLIGNPEYFSSFSALLISIIPYVGLTNSKHISNTAYNIYMLLIITGLTSFGYHWTGWYLFKHLDEIPMLLSIWTGILHLSEQYKRNFKLNFIINSYFTFILALNTIPSYQFLFPIMFSIALLSIIPLLFLKHKIYKYSFQKFEIYKLSSIGIFLSTLSGLIWLISEHFCSYKFILAHSFWHFGIGMGVYYIIVSEEILKNLKQKKNVKIKYLYKIIPIIN